MIFAQSDVQEAGATSSILTESLAVTTNATFINQTFGITFGTSQCEKPSKFVYNGEVNKFVHANMDNLAKDISTGQGETVSALAKLLEVPEERRYIFYSILQDNFDQIFPHPDVNYAHVVDTVGLIAH